MTRSVIAGRCIGIEPGMTPTYPVLPGLVPGIHVLDYTQNRDVDGPDKPGRDANCKQLR